jgi:serine/threonine protein kinase
MHGGTLYDLLHSDDSPTFIQRLHIALDAAEGLNYLHKFTRSGIVHRDIKSNNILLDANNNAKVSDFGLSRTILSTVKDADNKDRTIKDLKVTHIAGTYGYMDPEWFTSNKVNTPIASTRSDVYAFGVVLLEILTGKSPLVTVDDEMQTLVTAVQNSVKDRKYINIIDNNMAISNESYNVFVQLTTLALECCSINKDRPVMNDVAKRIANMYDIVELCNNNATTVKHGILSPFQQLQSTFDRTDLLSKHSKTIRLTMTEVLVPR